MRKLVTLGALLLVLGAICAPALAQGGDGAAAQTKVVAPKAEEGMTPWKAMARIGACLGAAIAAAGGAYGVGKIGGACIESIARQPEAARDMFAPMVVAAGMVEVGMLFAIVVSLLCIIL
jgi:F-type H+-transporting ATPase subunit c